MTTFQRPTRRTFLAGTAGITAAAAIPAAAAPVHPDAEHRWPDTLFPPGHHPRLVPHPDAALLIACAEFDDLELQYQAPINNPYGEIGRQSIEWERAELVRREPLVDAQQPLIELIGRTPAITLDGMRAKARNVVLWNDGALDYQLILSSLLGDLVAGSAGA